jgi:hypothetical protein
MMLVLIVISFLIVTAGAVSCDRAAPNTSSGIANTAVPTNNPHMKTLQFSGYDWLVKTSDSKVGPGPNYFSDSADNVFVDAQGQLHLRITESDGRWYCAEIISTRSFSYGTYRF